MIDLDRNSKKQLVEAKGKRTRESSIYRPNQKRDFKISRGRFSDFLSCPRCFYLDRVIGLKPPGTPGWSLNETTDFLLKKEFDDCRKKKIPHRLFSKFGLNHVIPFNHKDIDKWRNSLSAGLQVRYKNSNIILTGGIDDVWIDLNTNELIVVDYKSQAKGGYVEQKEYLEDPYHQGYKIQMDFYAYLLTNMGFKVKDTAYFLVCNAKRSKDGFYGQMEFDEYLIPYHWSMKWIDPKVNEMIDLMNQLRIPLPNKSCNNCAYSNQYAIANGTSNKGQFDPLSNVENNKELTEAKERIRVMEESLEKLNNEKKSQENIYDEETINSLNTSIQELKSRSESYAEILSEPQLLKEYYEQFFGKERIDEDSIKENEQLKETYRETKEKLTEAVSLLQEMSKEHKSWEEILTNPDVLSEYVLSFFGKDGPYPINDYQSKLNLQDAKIAADLFIKNNSYKQINDKLKNTEDEVLKLKKQIKAYRKLLTEPNLLADYIAEFFDEKGPYPLKNHPKRKNFAQAKELADYFLSKSDPNQARDEKDIHSISKSITVAIQTLSGNSSGTGVLIKSKNNIHTVLTARHVIQNHDFKEDILVRTEIDNIVYIVDKHSIRLFGDLDLASLEFISQNNYLNASIGDSSLLNQGNDIWISGYSDILKQTHLLYPGKLMGTTHSSKDGNILIYNNPTRFGSSGGPVLNSNGQIVGINLGVFLDPRKDIQIETGINFGIAIEHFTGVEISQDQKSKEIISFINSGIQEFIDKKYKIALSRFNQIIDYDPNSHVSFFYRAKIKEALDDKQGAINDYLNVIKLDPSFPGAYNNLGLIMFFIGDKNSALKYYDLGLKYSPEDASLLANRGFLKMELGLIQDSLNDFNLSLKRNPKNSKCYALRGILLFYYFENFQNALEDLNQAIKLDPKNFLNYLTRFRMKDSLGDTNGQGYDIEQAKKLLKEYPPSEPISDDIKQLIKKYLED